MCEPIRPVSVQRRLTTPKSTPGYPQAIVNEQIENQCESKREFNSDSYKFLPIEIGKSK